MSCRTRHRRKSYRFMWVTEPFKPRECPKEENNGPAASGSWLSTLQFASTRTLGRIAPTDSESKPQLRVQQSSHGRSMTTYLRIVNIYHCLLLKFRSSLQSVAASDLVVFLTSIINHSASKLA